MYTEHYAHMFMGKYCTPPREILFICTIFIIYIFSEPLLRQQFPAFQKLTQLSFC